MLMDVSPASTSFLSRYKDKPAVTRALNVHIETESPKPCLTLRLLLDSAHINPNPMLQVSTIFHTWPRYP